ncbi:hippurate hydrolase [Roseimicrobium gellanilyticum]|uniref:Hippurate hydrolase n=1 Tax=Roseimicrobium gellanilyticum TaxID=748857 RepID=A0A366HUU4_9BACT|nr:amidohydrolase [Roseimicrobium gellanilyticum]RBP47304.1 hippurate hydrolase [Roseimicrobium gellanilyticum]
MSSTQSSQRVSSSRLVFPVFGAALLGFSFCLPCANSKPGVAQIVLSTKLSDEEHARLKKLYEDLHAAPELSFHEEKTSQRLAKELREAGFTVTEKVGGWGVVGVLKNGEGRTVLVRTDMDALPVREMTGLPFASKVRVKDTDGTDVPVMHACGHDMHMACWTGTARWFAENKKEWNGTLVFIGQPAEEKGGGSAPMLEDGLYTRFPKPDACVALHCNSDMAVGTFGLTEGPATANVDSVDITVRGVGGHGSAPHTTKDPVVLAAQIIVALQMIDSREIDPREAVVITVGSIHGGTKHNIIPDEVKLQLTIRTFNTEVRGKTLAAIRRIAEGMARTAGLPDTHLPIIKEAERFTPVVQNDPALTKRIGAALKERYGEPSVKSRRATMGGEDFSRYGMTEDKIPICMFWLGTIAPPRASEAEHGGPPLPSLHSPFYKPESDGSLQYGVGALTTAVQAALAK